MSGTAPQATALAPVAGMKRIPFPLESYEHPSKALSSKRLMNMFAEVEPNDARTATALVPVPGLGVFASVGLGPILALNDDVPGRLYIVSGHRFYRMYFPVAGGFLVDDLGDIGEPDTSLGAANGFITIAAGPTAVVVCVTPRAWTTGHDPGTPMNEMTDTFPGAGSVAYLNGYFGFSSIDNTSRWFVSGLLDPANFDALDFAYSDAFPDVVRRIISHRGQFWCIGEAGLQPWYDSGDADFPFRPQPGAAIPQGTGSPLSVCRADSSIWWVGLDGFVYRTDGYKPVRVSTHAIESIIGDNVVGIHALTHFWQGHSFYVLTTLTGQTLAYDANTKAWADRSSGGDALSLWPVSSAAVSSSIHVFGDRNSPNLYRLLPGQATNNGTPILRQITFPPLYAGTNRAFCNRVEIEMEVGTANSPTSIVLDWSDDGGTTFSAPRTLDAGALTQTRKRVFTTRLGSFRQRVFRITIGGIATIYGLDADITQLRLG